MIMDCAIYRKGERESVDGDLSDALDVARENGDAFMWIGLHEPTREEFDLVAGELQLHPLAIEDAVNAHQRPKLERYGDTLFVVVKTLHYVDATSDIEVGEIMLFVGADFVITVRHGQGSPLKEVRRRLEADTDLICHGPGAVLYTVLDEVVDRYEAIAHEVETDIIELEREVFSPQRVTVTEKIYDLKREVLEFRGAEDPLIPVLQDIVKRRVELPPGTLEYFRDVLDHLLRVDERVDSHSELLTNVLNAHLAQVGMQQNEDMRKISAWAAILAVPTMVTGVYGMNFEHMPELKQSWGYPAALLLILTICVGLYRWFRKSGWL
ncbi:magnesium/cobalt transporter CorA [Actinoallomurus purpureus]|uniref:magnesium/cobalt transporter CorA n=1 Tax=Actinoallomurus purpureus TaxID=478114 RepID=UPI00209200B5|nr:magnesium/cobalt transporter CorA [Actinoallomurus purpureus]MCO6007806.1 magnesium/cobalt transporter CorA [Actinoallomurus purpureus]